MSLFAAFIAVTFLTGFRVAPKTYNQGYADGYAIGYNVTCAIRAVYLNGDWDSPDYKSGYVAGLRAGVRACHRGPRRQNNRYWD
ncbi:MAG: hypothetical protein ACR2PG_13805 [Hyphomicrobiaceae bacterium]